MPPSTKVRVPERTTTPSASSRAGNLSARRRERSKSRAPTAAVTAAASPFPNSGSLAGSGGSYEHGSARPLGGPEPKESVPQGSHP